MTGQTLHNMLGEIREEPEALARLLEGGMPGIKKISDTLKSRRLTNVVVAARGTSDHAGQLAKYIFEYVNEIPVSLSAPSIYTLYEGNLRLDESLVLGISQSGEGPDVAEVIRRARRGGASTVAITNNMDSLLAREAEFTIDCHAGVEKSVAATKTYLTELAAIYLLSFSLAGRDDLLGELRSAIAQSKQALEVEPYVASIAPRYRYMDHCVILGRGFNYCTVFEASLKLKETCYVVAEPYSSADFLHGPIALIEPGFPAFLIAPPGKTYPGMVDLHEKLIERGAETVVISSVDALVKKATIPIRLPVEAPEYLTPLFYIVPMQLLSYYLAITKGFDPDKPRGLRKVTMTR